MSLRQLCREGNKATTKALFLFPQETKTGIAPIRLIFEKNVPFKEGDSVTVKWSGKRVQAEILALHGKLSIFFQLIAKNVNTNCF